MADSSNNNGYIKIFRGLLKWEWYDDTNTVRLFLHCLLKANWEIKKWHGIEIEAGQFVTSLATLSKETCLSIQQVRTALEHLESTGEITNKSQSKFRVITVNNWSCYQGSNKVSNKQITNKQQGEQQTNNKQVTTTKEYKEIKEEKNINNKKYIYGEFRHVKLTDEERDRLFKDYGEAETLEAIKFLDEYKERKGYTSKNDNLTLRKWVFDAVKRDKTQFGSTSTTAKNTKIHNFDEREYDFAALEQEILKGGQSNG